MNGKIHRATVTQAGPRHVGSPTIDADPSEPAPGAPAQLAGR